MNLKDAPVVFPPPDVVQGAGKVSGKRDTKRLASSNRVGAGIDSVSSLASAVIAPKGRRVKPEDDDDLVGRTTRIACESRDGKRPTHHMSASASGHASPDMTDVEDLK